MTTHALTIDLEDWHQLFHRRITGELIPPSPAVVADTHRLLDLLDEVGIRATFFVLGLVCDAYPELVREVASRGHEIGSHTYYHNLVYKMDRASFRADAGRSVKQLQDLTGQSILGFRAPEFSVKGLDHWSFEVLAEMGFRYDSSVYPLPWARYGIPQAPRHPFAIATPSGTILEFPLATWQNGPIPLPIAGGSYFRFLSGPLLRRALADLDAGGYPAVLYFHPYEFHRGWLSLTGLSAHHRRKADYVKYTILHNFCTGRIIPQLRMVFDRFRFAPLAEICRRAPLP